MYIYNTKIRLFHTDAAGLIFYSNLFNIAYECYEEFLEKSGFSVKKILNDGKLQIPVVHAEADYFKPLRLGDEIKIIMTLNSSGKSSFTLDYILFNECDEKVARVKTTHVLVDVKSGRPITIPKKLFEILGSLNI
ncbi:MAG: acyl-CoA thioesterase [Candidatus Humimicrobiaceae bacterium]